MARNRSPTQSRQAKKVAREEHRETVSLSNKDFEIYTETREGKNVDLVNINIATVDVINRNRRFYPKAVYESANERSADDLSAGRLWGLLEHPSYEDGLKGRLDKIALKYESLDIKDDTVVAKARILDTEAGRTLAALLKAGIEVGVSTNGWTTGKAVEAKKIDKDWPVPDEFIYVVEEFGYMTIDVVANPSNPGGVVPRREGKEIIMNPILAKLAKKYNITPEQVKEDHLDEYLTALESTQATNAVVESEVEPVVTQAISANTTNDKRVLENTVLQLQAELEQIKRAQTNGTRTNIALTALEAAKLPKSKKVGDLDLDASFRQDLESAALGAASDEDARKRVDQMITERRALLGLTAQPDRGRVTGESLPTTGSLERLNTQESQVDLVSMGRNALGLR